MNLQEKIRLLAVACGFTSDATVELRRDTVCGDWVARMGGRFYNADSEDAAMAKVCDDLYRMVRLSMNTSSREIVSLERALATERANVLRMVAALDATEE